MSYSYLVLGSGRQGVAAAYDLARFGEADRVTLADFDLETAQAAAARVNALSGASLAEAAQLDVSDAQVVQRAMRGYSAVLSAVPYYHNLELTQAAIQAGVSFCDLGGNTEIVRRQHALDESARRAGVRIVPDCGMGPGMGNTLAVYAMSLLDEAQHVYIYDGGLPQEPKAPWNYQASFSLEGLVNEYSGSMAALRDGQLVDLPCFSEPEIVNIPPLGHLEAFVAAGGASTAPWSFQGRLQTYLLKILRYPGTYDHLKGFSDLGLFSAAPVKAGGVEIAPRDVFIALYGPQVQAERIKDICLIHVRALGHTGGAPAQAFVDLVDRYDEATGFSAMQRTTGWHASIVAILLARGETPLGAQPLEAAVPGEVFVREARRRGLSIQEHVIA